MLHLHVAVYFNMITIMLTLHLVFGSLKFVFSENLAISFAVCIRCVYNFCQIQQHIKNNNTSQSSGFIPGAFPGILVIDAQWKETWRKEI